MPEFPVNALASQYRRELFDFVLPFWERFGVDYEQGGFLCLLDYDGTLVGTEKHLWFQGRGLWVYSYLFQHFGRSRRHLATARAARDFLLQKAKPAEGWWPEILTREGNVARPFHDDPWGMFFAVEGLAEFAAATGDAEAREEAAALFRRLWDWVNTPAFQAAGLAPGLRPQGVWMCCLQLATAWLARWQDGWVREIADAALDAIVHRHYSPYTGLNREVLRYDFSAPPEEETRCVAGHSVECLWMAGDEAARRGDERLFDLCAARLRDHLDAAWDPVYGGLADAVRVGASGFRWPAEAVIGSDLTFASRGQYHWRKTYWAVNEVIVAAMKVWERRNAPWAAEYLTKAQRVADEKFSLVRRGLGSHVLVTDRQLSFPPRSVRQDNYHPLRRLLYGLQALERLNTPAGSPTEDRTR